MGTLSSITICLQTVNYNWNEDKSCNEIEQITPDGIAEAFVEFAKKEQLSFSWRPL